MLILIAAAGPDKGRIYELLDDQEMILGREGEGICLNDRKVSRKHARLWSEGGRWYVEDLGSRHGTLRNHKTIDKPMPIKDGDFVQLGNTVFVMSRMPVEHAERFALLGEPGGGEAFRSASRMGGGRAGRIAVGAAVAASLLIVGFNAFTWFDTSSQTQLIQTQLAELHDAGPGAAPGGDMLRDYLAAAEDQRAHDARVLQEIRTAVTAKPESVKPMLDQILASVDRQRDASRQIALLREAIEGFESDTKPMLDQLAKAAEKTESNERLLTELAMRLEQRDPTTEVAAISGKLDEALARLDEQPTPDELFAAYHTAATQDRAEATDLMQRMFDQMAALPDAEAIAAKTASQLADQQARSAELLTAIMKELDAQPTTQEMLAAITNLGEQLPKSNEPALAAITERLDSLKTGPTTEQITAAVREVVASQPDRAAPMLRYIQTQLASMDRTDDVLAAIEQIRQSMPGDATAQLEALAAKLSQQPTADQLAAAIKPHLTQPQTDAALAKQAETLAKLDAKLASLEAAQASQPGSVEPMLKEIRDALAQRQNADAKLAEIQTILQAQGASQSEVQTTLKQVLAAMQSSDDTKYIDSALAKVIDAIQAEQEATTSGIRTAVREEVRSEFSQRPIAFAQVPQVTGQTPPSTGAHPGTAMASAASGKQETASADKPAEVLSRTEEAYKLAFETSQPVAIGAGLVNPETGEVSEGRVLDPAAARAAGIKHWRDWYLMDDFAERMRLQKQAMHYVNQASSEKRSFLRLPPAGPTGSQPKAAN